MLLGWWLVAGGRWVCAHLRGNRSCCGRWHCCGLLLAAAAAHAAWERGAARPQGWFAVHAVQVVAVKQLQHVAQDVRSMFAQVGQRLAYWVWGSRHVLLPSLFSHSCVC